VAVLAVYANEYGAEVRTPTPPPSGDITPCKVTPVILHGTPVILHGVVSPDTLRLTPQPQLRSGHARGPETPQREFFIDNLLVPNPLYHRDD